MLCDLDALKGRNRRASVKYRWLTVNFDPRNLPAEYAREIAVLAATPGVAHAHIQSWMLWKPWTWKRLIVPIIEAFAGDPEVVADGAANAASVTEEDARDMLVATHIGRLKGIGTKGPVPVYGTMWLQQEFRGGRTAADIAESLGVKVGVIGEWKHVHGHMPGR